MRRITFLAVALSSLVLTPAVADIQHENPNACLHFTGAKWSVPVALLLAVHEVEGGKPGTISKPNKNGTVDMGPMQFNSATVNDLAKYGVSQEQMLTSWCASLYVAGWKLATSARRFNDWRLAIAAYNAGDGAVSNAIKKRHGVFKDVSELDIPASTKTVYVPRVMAAWQRLSAGK
jgi:soluble lytic murein transglycosylase-like protein